MGPNTRSGDVKQVHPRLELLLLLVLRVFETSDCDFSPQCILKWVLRNMYSRSGNVNQLLSRLALLLLIKVFEKWQNKWLRWLWLKCFLTSRLLFIQDCTMRPNKLTKQRNLYLTPYFTIFCTFWFRTCGMDLPSWYCFIAGIQEGLATISEYAWGVFSIVCSCGQMCNVYLWSHIDSIGGWVGQVKWSHPCGPTSLCWPVVGYSEV